MAEPSAPATATSGRMRAHAPAGGSGNDILSDGTAATRVSWHGDAGSG